MTATATAPYPNFWAGWEADVLKAAGLPVTAANVTFLANWHGTEGSAATNNPLNVTSDAAIPSTVGFKTLNSAGVQYYATPAKGAAATAAFLGMSNYTAIRAALASGDPYSYASTSPSNLQDLTAELGKWGSKAYALVFNYESPGTPAPATTVTTTIKNPETGGTTTSTKSGGNPGDIFSGIESWLTTEGKLALAYVLIVGVAGGLFLTGLKGLGVQTPKMPAVVPA